MTQMKLLILLLIFFTYAYAAVGQPASREFKIKKGQTYLNLPVSNSARLIKARIKSGDKTLDQFTINLADANPDFWTFFDVTEFQGKSIVVEIENFTRPNFS